MWKLNENGDIEIGNNIKEIENYKQEVEQRLILKLSMFNGEWYLHEDEGMDWLQDYDDVGQLGQKLKQFNIEEQIRAILEYDTSVAKVLKLEVNFLNGTGELIINATVLLDNGETLTL